MIIINVSKDNLCFTTLKEKREEPDYTLYPGQWVDTTIFAISDEKVKKSSEVKIYLKMKKIRLADEIPDVDVPMEEDQKSVLEDQKQKAILEITSSSALSTLEDIIKNEKMDPTLRKAAYDRYQDLTGDSQMKNPELEKGFKNPTVG